MIKVIKSFLMQSEVCLQSRSPAIVSCTGAARHSSPAALLWSAVVFRVKEAGSTSDAAPARDAGGVSQQQVVRASPRSSPGARHATTSGSSTPRASGPQVAVLGSPQVNWWLMVPLIRGRSIGSFRTLDQLRHCFALPLCMPQYARNNFPCREFHPVETLSTLSPVAPLRGLLLHTRCERRCRHNFTEI